MLSPYLQIGQVLRPQGVRGQVKIRPDTDDPSRFAALDKVYVLSDGAYAPVPFSFDASRDGFVFGTLDNAASREQAEAQRDIVLYIDRENAVPLDDDRFFITDLVACSAEDEQGEVIGTIKDVVQLPANDVLVLSTDKGEMLLPFLNKVVMRVDVAGGRIVLRRDVLAEVAVYGD